MDLQKFELLLNRVTQAAKSIQRLKEVEKSKNLEIKELKESLADKESVIASLKDEIKVLKQDSERRDVLYKSLEDKIVEILQYLPDDNGDVENDQEEVVSEQLSMESETSEYVGADNKKIDDKIDNDVEEDFVINKETDASIDDDASIDEEEILKKFINAENTGEGKNLFTGGSDENVEAEVVSGNDSEEGSLFDEEEDIAAESVENDDIVETNDNESDEDDIFDSKNSLENDYEENYKKLLIDNEELPEIDFDIDNAEEQNDEDLPRGVL
ncbi:MAG TPA: hypothetical protein PLG34_05870 [Spirochaetota bacterium]|nr:MAG: hypothetical protein BWX91_01301 [Spirochaetes bacterium ADurb.Bin133]HNZ26812.1 hypothetical protein [Spirochaetota bacterium]HPY87489.1 hypothetical protein [Spirochaetota bacterium]HQB60700.1 hypothetical protein [Spirochaetota bacterium]